MADTNAVSVLCTVVKGLEGIEGSCENLLAKNHQDDRRDDCKP